MTNLLTLLACISMIESNDNDQAIGDHGKSRGRYQIQEATWKEFTATFHDPWEELAHNAECSFIVAKHILSKRRDAFIALNSRNPTTREIYLLWNCPSKVMRPSKKALATAIRFENLVSDYGKTKGTK